MSTPGSPCSGRGRMSRLPQQPINTNHHHHQPPPPPLAAQSYVAPFSWLLIRDVEQGRGKLNFSTWDEDDGEADDAADAVADGSMPPRRYVMVHPDAALSGAERQVLVDALEAMDRARGGGGRSGPGGGD
jgi:hypothetical protein